jgi:hypothetical protein
MKFAPRLLKGLTLCSFQKISEQLLGVDLAMISKTFGLVLWVFSKQVVMTLERLHCLDEKQVMHHLQDDN